MASWQSHVIKLALRLWQLQSYRSGSIQKERAALEASVARVPRKRYISYEPCSVAGLRAEWITAPSAAEDCTILYLHGGGYILGSINTHRPLAADLSQIARARVLLVEYRLAPEYPFPAALEDALLAYRWLLDQGSAPRRLAVAGDSAGGGLVISLLVAARDEGRPLPAAAACLSPFVDLTLTGTSFKTRRKADVMIPAHLMPLVIQAYLGETDPAAPLASPLYADMHGLPPLLIQVGTDEVLLDDATRLASRARDAGVAVTLEIWEGMFHSWQAWGWLLPEAHQALSHVGEFVRAHTR
jgi:monoterpene epsilon-lactone hydrolase